MWDIGADWAAYIAEEYFEEPDFMLGLLLKDKDVDLAAIKNEGGFGFMEAVDDD